MTDYSVAASHFDAIWLHYAQMSRLLERAVQKAIIVGASSGIGWELAIQLADAGYQLGLMARREDRLHELAEKLPGTHWVQYADVTMCEDSQQHLQDLIERMNGVDMVVLNSGVGILEGRLEWDNQRTMIDVNVRGFCALAVVAMQHFENVGTGHLVGISSLAAHVSGASMPTYHASKAFVTSYLNGLRGRAERRKAPITITVVEPGFVRTPMVLGSPPWMASVDRAVQQMMTAIVRKKAHVFITRRWRLVAWMAYLMPTTWLAKRF